MNVDEAGLPGNVFSLTMLRKVLTKKESKKRRGEETTIWEQRKRHRIMQIVLLKIGSVYDNPVIPRPKHEFIMHIHANKEWITFWKVA